MRVTRVSLRDQRGAVIPIVALSLVALFGMVVLTVDVGGVMAKRRSMVNGADSAALAAAQSYALKIEAQCGTNDGPAHTQANTFAADNIAPDVVSTQYTPNCAAQTVQVQYQDQQDLFFAPVLGFGDETPVVASATAHWGATQGGNPLPVELDPLVTNACVYEGGDPNGTYKQPGVCPSGYWFDNADLTKSGWGLMNLNAWDVGAADSCDNSGGANGLSGWILQTDPLSVKLKHLPTYVCTTDGGKTPNWIDALKFWAGKDRTFLFPINDPAAMILGPPTSIQKYAIVGFAPMQVVAVYDVGKDQAAAIGGTYSCTATATLAAGQVVDLSTATLTQVSPSTCSNGSFRSDVASVKVVPAAGGKAFGTPADYTVTSTSVGGQTHTLLNWKKSGSANVKISFNYRSGGACPGHTADPNAFCLLLKWAGPQLIGTDPGEGEGPAMAVELVR